MLECFHNVHVRSAVENDVHLANRLVNSCVLTVHSIVHTDFVVDGCTHWVVGPHSTVAGLGYATFVAVGLDYDVGLDVADCIHQIVGHRSTVVGFDCATAVVDNQAAFVENTAVVRYSWRDSGYPGCTVAGEPSCGLDNCFGG